MLPRLSGHWSASAPPRISRCARALIARGLPPAALARVLLVPGRIEVLGKHTDYAGGRSLLAATERGFAFVCVPRADATVRVTTLDQGESAEFAIARELVPATGWANYPMTVVRRIARDFPGFATGADIAMGSDLPPASGMSSSSALLVGIFLCLAGAGGLTRDPEFHAEVPDADSLGSYLAAIESGQGYGRLSGDAGVGTHGGSEDHTAILRARAGMLLQYRFVPAALERAVELPAGHIFVLASSGIAAEKTGAMRDRYNRASALARTLRDLWSRSSGTPAPSLAAALRSDPGGADRLRRLIREAPQPGFPRQDLIARLDHFVRESEEIVPAAAAALADGRLPEFGRLVDESQTLAGSLLGNQIAETVALAASARALGAVAASAFGAGYGGSVWALAEAARADTFLQEWRRSYADEFPGAAERAEFFTSGAGPSARRVA